MRKLFVILLSALSLTAFAQQKKVAVYVTGEDQGINKVLGSKLVSAIAQSDEYSAIERTESFLAELSKEQNYQRTGAVDDSELSRLGKQFGVQYICVAAVSKAFNEDYISARLIDVETAQVERSASSSGAIHSLDGIVNAANIVSRDLLSSLDRNRQSNSKKVAVYIVKNEAGRSIDKVLGDKLVAGFTNSGRYIAIERTNSFLSQMQKEQNYQRTGSVDDNEISRLGRQFGVQYVCVADVSDVYGEKYISARLIDVETAEVVNSYDKGGQLNSMNSCLQMANDIAHNLSKGTFKEQAERKEAERRYQENRNAFKRSAEYGGYVESTNGVNIKMNWVEGGECLIGRQPLPEGKHEDKKGMHKAYLEGFYIGIFEITQSQWEIVMGTTVKQQLEKHGHNYLEYNSELYGVGKNYPIYYVAWTEAAEFCRRLSNMTGKKYLLPTEDQWEYAAKGGRFADTTTYSGSSKIDEVAWYGDFGNGNAEMTTHPCGCKKSNALGLYDMSGNVREWCLDDYLSNCPPGRCVCEKKGECHVVKGGSWHKVYGAAFECVVSARDSKSTILGDSQTGFRIVCIP